MFANYTSYVIQHFSLSTQTKPNKNGSVQTEFGNDIYWAESVCCITAQQSDMDTVCEQVKCLFHEPCNRRANTCNHGSVHNKDGDSYSLNILRIHKNKNNGNAWQKEIDLRLRFLWRNLSYVPMNFWHVRIHGQSSKQSVWKLCGDTARHVDRKHGGQVGWVITTDMNKINVGRRCLISIIVNHTVVTS